MVGLIATLAFAALVVVYAVLIIPAKLQQRRDQHRREMEDLVRGRTGRAVSPVPVADVHQVGGVAERFTSAAPTKASGTPRMQATAETADLIRRLESIAATAKCKTPAEPKEDAWVLRAERMHQQLMAEVARDNQDQRSRPSGPCTLQISYVDAEGEWTTRKIAPYKSGNTNQKFDAWCETRQDRRTFFFERIRSAVDLTTGQSLTPAGVFQRVHPGRRVPAELR